MLWIAMTVLTCNGRIRTPSPKTSFHANSCSVESFEDSATATCKYNDQVLLVWYSLSLVAIFAIWIQYSFRILKCSLTTSAKHYKHKSREKNCFQHVVLRSYNQRHEDEKRRCNTAEILVSRQDTGCILHYWAAMLKYCQRSRGTPPCR